MVTHALHVRNAETEREVAYFIFDDIEEREDCIIIYCCKKACNDTQKVLCLKPDELYEHNSDKSVYKLYEANNVPELVDKRYMATKAAMRVIYDNMADDAEIYEALGRDGVELAEKIRKEGIERCRSIKDIPKKIVVSEICFGKDLRLIIWDLFDHKILDVVTVRNRKDDRETLERFIKRLISKLEDYNSIYIYINSSIMEIGSKFSEKDFPAVFSKDEIDTFNMRKIKSFEANIAKEIKFKRITSCYELDLAFPFLFKKYKK